MVAGLFTTHEIWSCSKDPIGHIDGENLYWYVRGRVAIGLDPRGKRCGTDTEPTAARLGAGREHHETLIGLLMCNGGDPFFP